MNNILHKKVYFTVTYIAVSRIDFFILYDNYHQVWIKNATLDGGDYPHKQKMADI